ncbi:MAG TPA: hypothetical protein PKK26_06415 [Candidatus Wallbacteria bacterium]|nr:hypothetical protein [Candidatus Wallbacteria bacterium]
MFTNRKLKIYAIFMSIIFTLCFATPEPAHAGFFDSISSAVSSAVTAAKDTVKKGAEIVADVAGVAVNAAKTVVENAKEVAKKVYETAKSTVKSVISSITGAGKQAVETAKDTVTAVGNSAEKAADVAKSLPDKFTSDVNNAINSVKDFVSGKKQDFEEYRNMVQEFKEKGIDLISDSKDEVEGAVHPVLARMKLEAQKALDAGKEKAADFAGLLKSAAATSAKSVDLTKDVLAEGILKNGKNSIVLASAMKEFKSADGSQSFKNMFGMGGVSYEKTGDIEGHAKNAISAHESLTKFDAYLGPRYKAEYNGKFFGDNVAVTASTDNTLGAWARGSGNVKWMKDGAILDAKGKAEVGVGFKSENEAQITTKLGGDYGTKTSARAEVMAGAQARANGTAYVGKNGIELSGKAEARCGAWVEGNVNHAVQYKGQDLFGVGAGGGVGAGVGAGVQGGFSFKANKIGFQNLGFTLGPIKVNATFYVNPVGLAEMAVDKGKEAVKAVADTGKKVLDKGKEVLDKLNPFKW